MTDANGRPHLLILGGTAEARELAGRLHEAGFRVVTSLAGRVSQPRLPPGEVRIGGFGGADGLRRWLIEHQMAAVVDATHPFAAQISRSAAGACAVARVTGNPFQHSTANCAECIRTRERLARATSPCRVYNRALGETP